jgi:hypothetical protein
MADNREQGAESREKSRKFCGDNLVPQIRISLKSGKP